MKNTKEMDFLTLADVLTECSSLEAEEKFPEFAEIPTMDVELTNLDECTELKQLRDRDFLNNDAFPRNATSDEDPTEFQELQDIMTLTHPGDLLVPMWNPSSNDARDSIISDVISQIEVCSENSSGQLVQDMVYQGHVAHSPGSTGDFTDYGSEDSGSEHSVMDLSISTGTRYPYSPQTKLKTEVEYDTDILLKNEPFHIPPCQDLHNRLNGFKQENYETNSPHSTIPSVVTSHPLTDSGSESGADDSDESNNKKGDRKRPGRKKGQVSKVYHLWEFIRDMLADPACCPKVIKWENREEGIFRVVQSEQMAAMWGKRKNNRTKMTYEKMSRSIRYSRKEGYFADIPKDRGYPKKLCFKFGDKSHGWDLAKS